MRTIDVWSLARREVVPMDETFPQFQNFHLRSSRACAILWL